MKGWQMSGAEVLQFDPSTMPVGCSHGGLGLLLASRVRESRPGSSIHHIDLVVLEPGATIGDHRHAADNEEIYIVVSGHGQMQIEDAWVPVTSGSVIPNPPRGQHGFVNTSDAEVRLVVIQVAHADTSAQSDAQAKVDALAVVEATL
jgi:mannose-6-phosphate isomerase-like protein (cupin superfamily)